MKRGLTVVLAVIVLLVCSFLIYRNVEIQKANKKIGQIRNEVVTYLNTKNGCSENDYDYRNGAISQKGASPMNGKDDKHFKHDENKF